MGCSETNAILFAAVGLVPIILAGVWIREFRAGRTYSSLEAGERRTEFARGMARNSWADVMRFLVGLVLFCLAVEGLVYLVPGTPLIRYVAYIYGCLITVLLDVRRNRLGKEGNR